ncbi:aspartate kinase [Christiangramia aquimixticola]|uniref:aspartate kinase n=1 Tax=Christiangramia aquimixticola TaxID=1697558 RepID=UPI003AA980C3
MKVLKFGGTSVGSAASIQNVKNIVLDQASTKILVLSAMSGVTNKLVEICESIKGNSFEEIQTILEDLRRKHFQLIEELISDTSVQEIARGYVEDQIGEIKKLSHQPWSVQIESRILTTGESLLTYIFSEFLKAENISNVLLDAKDFMHVHNLENPDTAYIGKLISEKLDDSANDQIYITQGFVRLNERNEVATLKRGGSDFTATILGAAVNASEIQIWTDISGLHNNDPRYVENTHPVAQLSFEEAAELAYFGAKILHPQTISPVIGKDIPVYLKNTFTPESTGTCISSGVEKKGLKAISAKDDITAIKIKSNRMLMAHGFLKKIFEVFDIYETAIDMITTSEIAISLTIDDTRNLNEIVSELQTYGEISVDHAHSIICVVGEGLIEEKGSTKIFEILNEIPVRMISYGGSSNNISLLVDTRHKVQTLQKLHEKLFTEQVLISA